MSDEPLLLLPCSSNYLALSLVQVIAKDLFEHAPLMYYQGVSYAVKPCYDHGRAYAERLARELHARDFVRITGAFNKRPLYSALDRYENWVRLLSLNRLHGLVAHGGFTLCRINKRGAVVRLTHKQAVDMTDLDMLTGDLFARERKAEDGQAETGDNTHSDSATVVGGDGS